MTLDDSVCSAYLEGRQGLKSGSPRIDIQYTNTANTLRVRNFFQMGNTNGWLGLQYTVCVPAT